MKILLISEIFPPMVGGSGRWFWDIYSRLPRENVVVVSGVADTVAGVDESLALRCYRLPLLSSKLEIFSLPGLINYVRLFRQLAEIVKNERITSIHCGRGTPEGFLGCLLSKRFKVSYLCYIHGEELAIYRNCREYNLLAKIGYNNSKRIIVNSFNTQREYVKYIPDYSGEITVMHPGVDTTCFIPAEKYHDFLELHGWINRKVMLTVGRLQKRKGHDHTILAMKVIAQAIPDILYAIVGDGEEMSCLKALVKEHHLEFYVQFLGKLDDSAMLSCYQQCDLFIMANREVDGDFEGFGIVFLEAQACGKPVIAGKSGGTAETMVVGETGLLVDGNDPEEIAKAVIQLFRDGTSLSVMGSKARDWVISKFDWSVLMEHANTIFYKQ